MQAPQVRHFARGSQAVFLKEGSMARLKYLLQVQIDHCIPEPLQGTAGIETGKPSFQCAPQWFSHPSQFKTLPQRSTELKKKKKSWVYSNLSSQSGISLPVTLQGVNQSRKQPADNPLRHRGLDGILTTSRKFFKWPIFPTVPRRLQYGKGEEAELLELSRSTSSLEAALPSVFGSRGIFKA